ncbi:type I restriction endonuclease subunit R [uncultured Xanthomonas sp.]|uniref:type I restriction endonuclease subunit R n=1 Tax=uncultured Xanthomonas sp. TaxID=152831 RepID=UPI0025CD4A00|nr:type I restriction endonuclease subunit R [uncultured Xanthomonas sp.]
MAFLSEAEIEKSLVEQLRKLGYSIFSEEHIGPDSKSPERESHDVVVLHKRIAEAIARLNPHLPAEPRQDAIRKLTQYELPNLLDENRRIHNMLIEGVDVEYYADDGVLTAGKVRVLDFDNPANNDWLAVRQFAVISGAHQRRPDVVLFVNGLPLAVIELKAPGSAGANLVGAFNQLQTYKQQIAALFRSNAVLVTSDGIAARIGSLSADLERFMPWRTTDGTQILPKGQPELPTLIEGVFAPQRFLDLLRWFTVFGETGQGLAKLIAGYHQYHAVNLALASTIRASVAGVAEDPAHYGLPSARTQPRGDRKAGVIWHTQGSGKSLLMAFYAGRLVQHPTMHNPTLVVLTDRNDLDDQLFATFAMCKDLVRQTPVQAESREDLQRLLARASGGVIFSTLQKFGEVAGPLTLRQNVVVIADEAHRSQYGLKAKLDRNTGEISYGFAKYMRDALPNASFIGFTGTPIEAADVNTPALFGHYIDVYDISRAVEDGATVPIYYESRLARIELNEDEKPTLDDEVEALFEGADTDEKEKLKGRAAAVERLVGSEKRLALIAQDLVAHLEERLAALDGKAMAVCMSREICVDLYEAIIKLRPHWHSDDDAQGVVKVVMTGAASDPGPWQAHIGNKARRDALARRAKDPRDPLKLVLVRDMWLTGFDAPCMHTLYVDKPMKGHGLMQAIARVNRVFRDKPAGLIVDYIGIAQNLKSALAQYSPRDRENTGIDEAQAIAHLLERYEVVRAMYHGFDYLSALQGTPQQRLAMMAGAIEWILDRQQQWAAVETTEEGKKAAHRRYRDAVLALSRAYALSAASDQAAAIRDEVGFFQAIREALLKSASGSGLTSQERDLAIRQIVSRAVVSTEIVDILKAAGIQSPDISILSDEFLAEMQQLDKKNLALEALRKLLNDGIRSRSQSNIVQTKAFSQRLEDAIARYHANAITTAEVLQELIKIAKDIRAARARGEEQGLSADEIAFYDALAENASAVQVMGDENLRVIAHELLVSLKGSVSVDWARRDSARARMRVLVKRILRKYGYPPDLQDAAVQVVLRQAEALSASWVS